MKVRQNKIKNHMTHSQAKTPLVQQEEEDRKLAQFL